MILADFIFYILTFIVPLFLGLIFHYLKTKNYKDIVSFISTILGIIPGILAAIVLFYPFFDGSLVYYSIEFVVYLITGCISSLALFSFGGLILFKYRDKMSNE